MTNPFSINPEKSALLILDFQKIVLRNYLSADDASAVLAKTAELLAAARGAHMPIIHVMVAFRHGHPEISSKNKLFSAAKDHGLFTRDAEDTAIHPAVAPADEELTVIKHRIGPFSGTDLETLLRAKNTETLIVAGVTTAGVVLSTVRQAFDRDYHLVVARDCCADPDYEVHCVLMDKVIAQHAEILTAHDIALALRPASPGQG